MTQLISVVNQTIVAAYGGPDPTNATGYFTPQQSLTFTLSAAQIIASLSENQNTTLLMNAANVPQLGEPVFQISATLDSSGNLQNMMYVTSFDGSNPAPTTGSDSFSVAGTSSSIGSTVTLSITGTINITSLSPETVGDVTIVSAGGTTTWTSVGLNVDPNNLLSVNNFNILQSADDYASGSAVINFEIDGVANPFVSLDSVSATQGLPLGISGLDFQTVLDTGIEYQLDGGAWTNATSFSFSPDSGVTVNPPGGAWFATAATINDTASHTLTVRSAGNTSSESTSQTFSAPSPLVLDQLFNVVQGTPPAITGTDGYDPALTSLTYQLDNGALIPVPDYVPATFQGGPWYGEGPATLAGTHTLQVYGTTADSVSAASNEITYVVPPLSSIMFVS